jgi:ABC-type Fe2+-enterobactin transport system substrate-binding protein
MQNFIFKPKNYNSWSKSALNKILKTMDSCENEVHLESVKIMIDNFIIISAINEDINENNIDELSKQLWLSYKLKQNQIISNII